MSEMYKVVIDKDTGAENILNVMINREYSEIPEICRLMNEMDEICKQLKNENSELYHKVNCLQDMLDDYVLVDKDMKKVEKENKWLKQRVSQLECLLELEKLHKEVDAGKTDKFVEWKSE